jgi:hypothetical protein
MSQLSVYLQLLIQKLAQSNTGFHTAADRTATVNEAILKIADNYEVPELRKRPLPAGTITFLNGLSPIPADLLRVVKLWDPVQPTLEYTYIVNDLFDQQSPNAANLFWTIDFNPVTATQQMYIVPSNLASKTLNLRYIALPTVLVNPTDESGLTTQWDNAVAYKAASILLNNERNPAGGLMEQSATMEIEKAIQAIRKVGGVKTGERLRSRFEKYPLLDNPQV